VTRCANKRHLDVDDAGALISLTPGKRSGMSRTCDIASATLRACAICFNVVAWPVTTLSACGHAHSCLAAATCAAA